MAKKSQWTGGILGVARFSYRIIDNPPTLKIRYSMPEGSGICTDVNHSMIRPFRKILNDAKYPGKITYVFIRDEKKYHVLGAFSHTNRNIIFFPGVVDKRLLNFGEDELLSNGIEKHVDHFTLENNLDSWHVTVQEKEFDGTRFKSQKTKKIDENNYLWFIFKISDLNKMDLLPKELRFELYESLDEIKRRLPIITKARENGIFQVTELNDKEKSPFFWYVEFFISKSNKKEDHPKSPVIVMPNKDTKILEGRKKAMMRTHQVFLDGFDGSVFVRVSKVQGTINSHIIFESGQNIIPSSK
ncbi:hypothetical protein [Nitrosopumilus adriaticus]|nr:hypothetical protein [Nitrosopumilus adriaticus]